MSEIKSQKEFDDIMSKQVEILMEVEKISKKQATLRMEAFRQSGVYERFHLDKVGPKDIMYQVVIDIVMSIPQLTLDN
jgi:hypothetical protein